MKLEITKERVISAAEACPTAKETLKTLFPEAFVDEKYLDFIGYVEVLREDIKYPEGFSIYDFEVRTTGEYSRKGFYLNDDNFTWEIITDSEGMKVLIPTKK